MLNVVFDADAVYYPGHVLSLQQCGAEPGDEAATTTTPTTVRSVLHCGEGALVVAAIPLQQQQQPLTLHLPSITLEYVNMLQHFYTFYLREIIVFYFQNSCNEVNSLIIFLTIPI